MENFKKRFCSADDFASLAADGVDDYPAEVLEKARELYELDSPDAVGNEVLAERYLPRYLAAAVGKILAERDRRITDLQEANTRYLERARAAEAVGAEMAEALEPFASEARFYGDAPLDWADELMAEISVFTCGELRAARNARGAYLAKTSRG